jgi:hypothetical protein
MGVPLHRAPRASAQSILVIGIFHEWRLANRLASQAEAIVQAALLRGLDKTGAGATDEQVENAKRLRGIANDLFETGMKEMAARAKSLKG